MQKIMISGHVTTDDSVDVGRLEGLIRDAIASYVPEPVYELVMNTGSVQIKPTPGEGSVWILILPDDEEPYYLVENDQDRTFERPLTDDEASYLLEHGVAIAGRGEYPRADKYGAPSWATNDDNDFIAGHHGFPVSADFYLEAEDSQDDSSETFWFKISLPNGSDLLKS